MTIRNEGLTPKAAKAGRCEGDIGVSVSCHTCKPKGRDVLAKYSTFDSLAPNILTRKAAKELAKIHEAKFSKKHRLVVTECCSVWGGGRDLTEAERRNGRVRRRHR